MGGKKKGQLEKVLIVLDGTNKEKEAGWLLGEEGCDPWAVLSHRVCTWNLFRGTCSVFFLLCSLLIFCFEKRLFMRLIF